MLLLIVLLLAFAVFELLYSKWANSLALVASAFFDVTDAVVLLVGVWGKTVTRNKKPTLRYSYGFERYEIIAKFGAASYFAFVCLWIFFEVGIIKFCCLFLILFLNLMFRIGSGAYSGGGAHLYSWKPSDVCGFGGSGVANLSYHCVPQVCVICSECIDISVSVFCAELGLLGGRDGVGDWTVDQLQGAVSAGHFCGTDVNDADCLSNDSHHEGDGVDSDAVHPRLHSYGKAHSRGEHN
jgi:hypothetical protein